LENLPLGVVPMALCRTNARSEVSDPSSIFQLFCAAEHSGVMDMVQFRRLAALVDLSVRATGGAIVYRRRTPAARLAQKPTIVLVRGVWGNAAHWSKVILRLSKMGYESICPVENSTLLTCGRRQANPESHSVPHFFGIIFGNFGSAIGFLSVGGVH
jgi:hypothetical protein